MCPEWKCMYDTVNMKRICQTLKRLNPGNSHIMAIILYIGLEHVKATYVFRLN